MPRPKRTEYAVELESRNPGALDPAWTPEHLVLAALARCSLGALAYHAKRAGVAAEATARATGAVSERDDGTWGFVELGCAMEATFEPEPDDVAGLVARAERGCFIGASLDPKPRYDWTVDGRSVAS